MFEMATAQPSSVLDVIRNFIDSKSLVVVLCLCVSCTRNRQEKWWRGVERHSADDFSDVAMHFRIRRNCPHDVQLANQSLSFRSAPLLLYLSKSLLLFKL